MITFTSRYTAGLTGLVFVGSASFLFVTWHTIPSWMLAVAIGSGCAIYLVMRLFQSLPILPGYFVMIPFIISVAKHEGYLSTHGIDQPMWQSSLVMVTYGLFLCGVSFLLCCPFGVPPAYQTSGLNRDRTSRIGAKSGTENL